MKITLESTTAITHLEINGASVPARMWQGETDDGIPVQAFITRIQPMVLKTDPEIDAKTADFERELQRQADPRADFPAIPLRMIL